MFSNKNSFSLFFYAPAKLKFLNIDKFLMTLLIFCCHSCHLHKWQGNASKTFTCRFFLNYLLALSFFFNIILSWNYLFFSWNFFLHSFYFSFSVFAQHSARTHIAQVATSRETSCKYEKFSWQNSKTYRDAAQLTSPVQYAICKCLSMLTCPCCAVLRYAKRMLHVR